MKTRLMEAGRGEREKRADQAGRQASSSLLLPTRWTVRWGRGGRPELTRSWNIFMFLKYFHLSECFHLPHQGREAGQGGGEEGGEAATLGGGEGAVGRNQTDGLLHSGGQSGGGDKRLPTHLSQWGRDSVNSSSLDWFIRETWKDTPFWPIFLIFSGSFSTWQP